MKIIKNRTKWFILCISILMCVIIGCVSQSEQGYTIERYNDAGERTPRGDIRATRQMPLSEVITVTVVSFGCILVMSAFVNMDDNTDIRNNKVRKNDNRRNI